MSLNTRRFALTGILALRASQKISVLKSAGSEILQNCREGPSLKSGPPLRSVVVKFVFLHPIRETVGLFVPFPRVHRKPLSAVIGCLVLPANANPRSRSAELDVSFH